MSMCVFPEYKCVHHMNTQCPRKAREGLRSLETEVIENC